MRRLATVLAPAALLALVVALAAAGCGSGGASTPTSHRTAPRTAPRTPPVDGRTMSVFFLKGESVERVVRPGAPSARDALVALLAGPTPEERSMGYSTAIPAGTRLLGYGVAGAEATVDFSGEMLSFGGGSAIVQAITGQVENTVMGNDGAVKSVSITVEGKPAEEVLQP